MLFYFGSTPHYRSCFPSKPTKLFQPGQLEQRKHHIKNLTIILDVGVSLAWSRKMVELSEAIHFLSLLLILSWSKTAIPIRAVFLSFWWEYNWTIHGKAEWISNETTIIQCDHSCFFSDSLSGGFLVINTWKLSRDTNLLFIAANGGCVDRDSKSAANRERCQRIVLRGKAKRAYEFCKTQHRNWLLQSDGDATNWENYAGPRKAWGTNSHVCRDEMPAHLFYAQPIAIYLNTLAPYWL